MGEVAEWLKAHAWKACKQETVSRVRIPLSPPYTITPLFLCFHGLCLYLDLMIGFGQVPTEGNIINK